MDSQNELSRATMNASCDVIYTLDSELRIDYCNTAWDRFARENGGERALSRFVIGRSVFDFIPTPLKSFYEAVFRRGRVAQFDYECSSANTFRLHRMIVLKQCNDGFAVVNSKRIERPHRAERRGKPAVAERYETRGMVVMCAHCRRSQRPMQPGTWDWVPGLVSDGLATITYELCPICRSYFFANGIAREQRGLAPRR